MITSNKIKVYLAAQYKRLAQFGVANLVAVAIILGGVLLYAYNYYNQPGEGTSESSIRELLDKGLTLPAVDDTTKSTGSSKTPDAPVVTQRPDETTVLEGETLADVAARVCNDAQKASFIAEENKLAESAKLTPGQKLKINCGMK